MSTIVEDEYDTINTILTNAVGPIAVTYRQFVEAEDLKQDCWEWVWRKQNKVREYLDREDKGLRKAGERALFVSLRRHAVRIAKKAKAEQSGYEVADEYYYSVEQIKDLLAFYFQGDWSAKMQVDESDQRYTKTLDPAEGNNVLASMSDIDYAFRLLNDDEQIVLGLLHRDPAHTVREVAQITGAPVVTVHRREGRALDKIQRSLGGDSPWH